MTENDRTRRMREVLGQRLGHVHCALEAVYHRHNVSAILRTCDALGLHHVHLVQGHFRAVKGAARGAERWLDLARHDSAVQAIEAIRAAGCRIYVADLADDGLTPEQVPLDKPVCLWFGAELVGVGPEVLEAADGVLTVPMRGFAQSLNVSVAAAVSLRPVAERARALGEVARLAPAERERTWSRWMQMERAQLEGVRNRMAVKLGSDPTGESSG